MSVEVDQYKNGDIKITFEIDRESLLFIVGMVAGASVILVIDLLRKK